MATVEDRVAQLERDVQELQQSRAADALAFGIGVVRAELGELRTETRAGFAAVNTRLDEIGTRFDDVNTRLDALTAGVAEILGRLSGGGQAAE